MQNNSNSYEFNVWIDNKQAKEYYRIQDDGVYIEGRRGSEFTLKFRNRTSDKVLVVLSVDGLSVMDGKPASEKAGGYLCSAWDVIEIPGWRVDNREIMKFKFQPQGDRDNKTYVEELASEGFDVDPANQGVIGVMVFKQKTPPKPDYVHHYHHHDHGPYYNDYSGPYYPYWINNNMLCYPNDIRGANDITCSYGSSMGSMASASAAVPTNMFMNSSNFVGQNSMNTFTMNDVQVDGQSSLGTGMGEAQTFKTQEVEFERQALPVWTSVIYYDTRSNLQKKGILFYEDRPRSTPNAFPAKKDGCFIPKSHR